jgi:hypothetical protein
VCALLVGECALLNACGRRVYQHMWLQTAPGLVLNCSAYSNSRVWVTVYECALCDVAGGVGELVACPLSDCSLALAVSKDGLACMLSSVDGSACS